MSRFVILFLCLAIFGSVCESKEVDGYPPAITYNGKKAHNNFGSSLAAYGDELVVGAINNRPSDASSDPTGNNYGWVESQGTVTVFNRNANGDFNKKHIFSYSEQNSQSILYNAIGGTGVETKSELLQGIGNSVAITASNIAAGCEKRNVALLFYRNSVGAWDGEVSSIDGFQQAETDQSCDVNVDTTCTPVTIGPGDNDHYGCSVALSSDTFAVAACAANSNQGHVYIYTKSGDTFSRTPVAILEGNANVLTFGTSLAISGNWLVVGAPKGGTGQAGEVFVFARNTQQNYWRNTKVSVVEDGNPSPFLGTRLGGRFGFAMSMTDASIVIGDHAEFVNDAQTTFQGEVIIWNFEGIWDSSTGIAQGFRVKDRAVVTGNKDYQQFGQAVGLSGTRFAVGGNDNTIWAYGTSTEGDLYGDGSWSDTLIASNTGEGGRYGSNVLVHDTYIAAGAPEQYGKVIGSDEAGAVYVYRIFEPSSLSITFYFGVSVMSISLLCFICVYIRFKCAPAGDESVVDAKLAAKAARLGYDHHNVAHKNIARKFGESESPKKYLAPQKVSTHLNNLATARSPLKQLSKEMSVSDVNFSEL